MIKIILLFIELFTFILLFLVLVESVMISIDFFVDIGMGKSDLTFKNHLVYRLKLLKKKYPAFLFSSFSVSLLINVIIILLAYSKSLIN
jgi:hypothetical protein